MPGAKTAPGAVRPARLDPLDVDYLAVLEGRDRCLSALLHEATRLRYALRSALPRLRAGADPGPVRAALEPWRQSLRAIKRLARAL